MTDRASKQQHLRRLLQRAISFVRSNGRHGGNVQVGPTLLMIIEFEVSPWKADNTSPRSSSEGKSRLYQINEMSAVDNCPLDSVKTALPLFSEDSSLSLNIGVISNSVLRSVSK